MAVLSCYYGIVQQSLINSTGVMFAAYTYQEDFILYGEVEIYRVSRDLLIKWIFLFNI